MLFLGSFFLLMTSCHQEKEEPRKEVKPPKDIISIKESKSLYDNYSRNRVAPILAYEREANDDEDFEVARYVDFDYKVMKQYIAFVEQEAKKTKVDVSTFRMYFANYPNSEKFPDGKKVVHPRQNSIFVLPTLVKNGENMGFYIGADGEAKLVRNAVKGDAQGYGVVNLERNQSQASFVPNFAASAMFQADQSLIMNHGQSGPPPPGDF